MKTDSVKRDFVKACKASDKIRKGLKDHPDKPFAEWMAKRLREAKPKDKKR